MEKNPCGQNGNCLNTPGGYYCECKPGFTGHGNFCAKFDAATNPKVVLVTKQDVSIGIAGRPTFALPTWEESRI